MRVSLTVSAEFAMVARMLNHSVNVAAQKASVSKGLNVTTHVLVFR
jgi:hypothetical protein